MRRLIVTCAAVAVIALLPTGSALAQNAVAKPDLVQPTDYPNASATMKNEQAKRADEEAYRAALKKIPDKSSGKSADPWGNLRSTAPAASTTK